MTARDIVLVAGARPNFMKLAPILRALAPIPEFKPRLVHTGQHYDDGMSAVFFEQLGLPSPDAWLNVGSGSHGVQTGRVMIGFEEYLLRGAPPVGVIVVGDVNSTVACALTATKLGIPVAHVESGLRSFDRSMPEEINRIVTDAISDLLLVSEPSGLENLRREGVPNERVVFVGNVMIDSVIHEVAAARSCGVVSGLGVAPKSFGLVTLHRPSNVDNPRRLREIVELLVDLSRHADVVAPLHPRTKGRLVEFGLRDKLQQARVRILDPVGYREMIALIESAQFVLTDSGGIQEETTFLGVPCMTLRENTERPITVTHGTNTVIGFDFALARMTIDEIRNGTYKRGRSIEGWDGNSSARIAAAILEAWAPR